MKKPFRGNKFRAIRTEYNGHMYDSKKEAAHAMSLDLRARAGEINVIERQVPLTVIINGHKCFKYVADFRVTYPDGRIEYQDVKGHRTGMYRLKKKVVEAYFGIVIVEK